MKKRNLFLLAVTIVIMIFMMTPTNSTAEINVSVGVSLPGLVIPAPPYMAVVPGTYVYYPSEVSADIFFYHGHWYRPHHESWFIANGYNGPWRSVATGHVPRAVINVPHAYREMRPRNDRIAHNDMRKNWRGWERERHWDHDEHGHGEGRSHDVQGWNSHSRHGDGYREDHGEHGRGLR
jgi:hypothetical protein